MGLPVPLPVGCRECGKRKREVAAVRCRGATAFGDAVISRTVLASRAARCCERRGSANGEAVAAGGFRDDAGGGHRGDALIECFGADAAVKSDLLRVLWCRSQECHVQFLLLPERLMDACHDERLVSGTVIGTARRLSRPDPAPSDPAGDSSCTASPSTLAALSTSAVRDRPDTMRPRAAASRSPPNSVAAEVAPAVRRSCAAAPPATQHHPFGHEGG